MACTSYNLINITIRGQPQAAAAAVRRPRSVTNQHHDTASRLTVTSDDHDSTRAAIMPQNARA
jgi:hypothetical protein